VGASADPAPTTGEHVRGARRLLAAALIAAPAFFRHRGTQLAAAISYRVLFSLVPFLALALSILDLVLSAKNESRVDEWLAGLAPGDADLQSSITELLSNTATVASITGLIALAGLLWTASGMAASVRLALAVVWEEPRPRPFLRAKLLDLVLVFAGVALLLAAFVASVSLQILTSYGTELAGRLGLERVDAQALGTLGQTLTTLALTIGALLALYRLAPSAPGFRDLLPGAIVGGIGVQLAILGFTVYVGVMAGFEELYGALAGVFGFLFLVYLVASAIVAGAEVVAAWPEAGLAREPDGPPKTPGERVRDVVRGLVRRTPDA
jgi:membrane protein